MNFLNKIKEDIITSLIILEESYYNFFEVRNTSKPANNTTNELGSLDTATYLIGFNSGMIANVDFVTAKIISNYNYCPKINTELKSAPVIQLLLVPPQNQAF